MGEKPFFKSKKFWAVASGIAVVVAKEVLGLDEATTLKIVGLVSSYVLGQGLADLGKNS
tara:strand:+ start:1935 stop:2111 length:177 start_codon:yes stop_codon:yes gene_type:complete